MIRFRPRLRSSMFLVAVAAVALAALSVGCGSKDVEGPRVRLLVPPGGDPLPSAEAWLVAPRRRGEQESRRYRLEPVEGGPAGLMVAPGAPDGRYTVKVDGPWRMLMPTREPPVLTRAGTPAEVPMGQGLSIFIGARDQARGRVGPHWRVDREIAPGVFEPVPAEVREAFFETVCIRLTSDAWRGRVRVTGRMQDGTPVRPIVIALDSMPADQALLRLVQPAPSADINAIGVGFGGRASPLLRAELLGSGLGETYEGPFHERVAAIRGVPNLGAHVRLSFPGGDAASTLDLADAERAGRAFFVLLDLGPEAEKARWVPLHLAEGLAAKRVLVRPATATAFARAPVRQREGVTEVRTLDREQTWWIETQTGAWIRFGMSKVPPALDLRTTTSVAGVRLTGQLRETASGSQPITAPGWQIVAELLEGGDRLVLDGAAATLMRDAQYSLDLPPGRWSVRAIGAGLEPRLGPEVTLDLAAGVRRRQPLSVR